MLAVQGPEARAALRADHRWGAARRACVRADLSVAGVPALVCGTGYTGEDGCELMIAPGDAEVVWDALAEQGVRPAGLGARDTLRLEVCFHLYGNDLSEDRNPIEAGLGWACKLDTGFVGADALRGVEPEQTLVPFAFTGPGIPRQDNPVKAPHGPGVVTSGSMSPCLDIGIGMAYVPVADADPGTEIEVDVRGKRAPLRSRRNPCTRKRRSVAEASYPDDLKYHEEHDWARIEGIRPTFGITWYAQDALGEVVFFDPPEVGTSVTKDGSYAEVESVKAVSDVFAPLSGEIVEVNEGLADSPEKINEDPYGDGWMVKVKLSDPSEVDALLDVGPYKELLS